MPKPVCSDVDGILVDFYQKPRSRKVRDRIRQRIRAANGIVSSEDRELLRLMVFTLEEMEEIDHDMINQTGTMRLLGEKYTGFRNELRRRMGGK